MPPVKNENHRTQVYAQDLKKKKHVRGLLSVLSRLYLRSVSGIDVSKRKHSSQWKNYYQKSDHGFLHTQHIFTDFATLFQPLMVSTLSAVHLHSAIMATTFPSTIEEHV